MKILITGSSGTIGTRLFEQLQENHDVIGTDITQNKWKSELDSNTINVDLRKYDELSQLPRHVDLIIHLAANARVYDLVKKPALALDNILMNFNVLEYAREQGINKFIFASSRETYGNIDVESALSEEMAKFENCESPYTASKIAGEALIHAYNKVYGLGFIITRFSNVYGMYDDSDRVIPLWIRQSLRGEDLTVFGKEKVLDFTYIDDAVAGVIEMINRFDHVNGNTINLGYGKGISLMTVAQRIRELTNAHNDIVAEDTRPGEVWKYEANISKARELLGYQPLTNIDEGLEKSVEWYKQYYSI